MNDQQHQIKELFKMVYQWGRVGLVVDETAPAFQSALTTLIATISAEAYKKGYLAAGIAAEIEDSNDYRDNEENR